MPKVIITGATSGIGLSLVKIFLKKNYEVIAIGRKKTKFIKGKIRFIKVDFKKKNSIKNFINMIINIKNIKYIIFSHGIMNFNNICKKNKIYDSEIFFVNFYSIMYFMKNFLSRRKKIDTKFLFITSHAISVKNKKYFFHSYNDWQIYKISKYFLILLNFFLSNKFHELKIFSINPGRVSTNLGKNNGFWSFLIKCYLSIFGKSKSVVASLIFNRLIIKKDLTVCNHRNLDYSRDNFNQKNIKKDLILINRIYRKL